MTGSPKGQINTPYPGHEALCAEMVEYIHAQQDHPTIMVVGPDGSGRDQIAAAVMGRLALVGYQCVPRRLLGLRSIPEGEQIRTIEGLLGQLADSLPVERLISFIEEHAGWIGHSLVESMRMVLRQRLDVAVLQRLDPSSTRESVSAIRQQLDEITTDKPTESQPEQRVIRLVNAICAFLSAGATPLALLIDLSYATPELWSFAAQLARRITPPLSLLLIVDSKEVDSLPELRVGRHFLVPLLTVEQMEQLCQQRSRLLNDPVAVARLHAISAGSPEIAELILDEISFQARSPSDYRRLILNDANLNLSGVSKRILQRMDEPVRALHAFSGMLGRRGVPKSDERDLTSLLHAFAQTNLREALDPSDPEGLNIRIEIWIQRYTTQLDLTSYLRTQLQQDAYWQEHRRRPSRLGAWSGWIAAYLMSQVPQGNVPHDPLLSVRYWLDAGQTEKALRQLKALFKDSSLALGSACAKPRELLNEIGPLPDVQDQADLIILSGDLAAAEGAISEAKDLCYQAIRLLKRDDIRCLAVFGQMMRMLQMPGDASAYAEMERYCSDWLETYAPPPRLETQIRCWRAAARGAHGNLQQDDERLTQAVTDMRAALHELELHQPIKEGEEEEIFIYRREHAFLADALARIECFLGEISVAKRRLVHERENLLVGVGNELLRARLQNNIGYISYYLQGETAGPTRNDFRDSFQCRHKNGDMVGAIHSASNLVGLLGESADKATDWDEALHIGEYNLDLAQRLREVHAAFNLRANLIEILIRRGSLEQARALTVDLDPPDPQLLTLKRAWCDLWADQREDCGKTLHDLAEALGNDDAPREDWWEWAQCALERALHDAVAREPDSWMNLRLRAAKIIAAPEPYGTSPRAVADSTYTHGLYHLTHDDPDAAIDSLERCRTLWGNKGKMLHPYRAACAGIWLVYAQIQIDPCAKVSDIAHTVDKELAPFGDIPARRLLQRIISLQ